MIRQMIKYVLASIFILVHPTLLRLESGWKPTTFPSHQQLLDRFITRSTAQPILRMAIAASNIAKQKPQRELVRPLDNALNIPARWRNSDPGTRSDPEALVEEVGS